MGHQAIIQKLAADALNSFRAHTLVVADALEENGDIIASILRKDIGAEIQAGIVEHFTSRTPRDLGNVVKLLHAFANPPYYLARSRKNGRGTIKVFDRKTKRSVLEVVPVVVEGKIQPFTIKLDFDGAYQAVTIDAETAFNVIVGRPLGDGSYTPYDLSRVRQLLPELDISHLRSGWEWPEDNRQSASEVEVEDYGGGL